jgi:hypothetical protein
MPHGGAKNDANNDVPMETNRFFMSTPQPEIIVDDDDNTNNYNNDLDLFSPIHLQNNNHNQVSMSQNLSLFFTGGKTNGLEC